MADITPAPTHGTVEEAADVLRVSRMTVYRLLNDGTLTEVRIGHRRFVTWESIDRLLTPNGAAS
jgi:excisionase family DNA binding protein